jgi:hypothetical protein
MFACKLTRGSNEPCMLITLINAGQLANIAGPDGSCWCE